MKPCNDWDNIGWSSVVVSMERSLNRCVICVVAVTDDNFKSSCDANSIMAPVASKIGRMQWYIRDRRCSAWSLCAGTFSLANIIMVMNLTVNEGYVGSSPT